jgi:RimJ/RimL family protein N-acetyltransferase
MIRGSGLFLRSLEPPDHKTLYDWAGASDFGARWRGYTTLPSMEEFIRGVWAGVHQQELVCRERSGDPLGLVTSYNADLRSGTSYLALIQNPAAEGTGHALFGFAMFVNALFTDWPFRKFYVEVHGYNLPTLGTALTRLGRTEAVLKDHVQFNGRYWDRHIVSFEREAWDQGVGAWVARRCELTSAPT